MSEKQRGTLFYQPGRHNGRTGVDKFFDVATKGAWGATIAFALTVGIVAIDSAKEEAMIELANNKPDASFSHEWARRIPENIGSALGGVTQGILGLFNGNSVVPFEQCPSPEENSGQVMPPETEEEWTLHTPLPSQQRHKNKRPHFPEDRIKRLENFPGGKEMWVSHNSIG